MTDREKLDLKRAALVLGVLVSAIAVLTAARSLADERYVRRELHDADMAQIKSDLRVLRCKVAKDCS